MAKLIRRFKKALAERFKKAKKLGYWNDSHIDQGFIEKRKRQKRFREQVLNGNINPQFAVLISREIAKKSLVRYRKL
jgi:hypothetical protein